jgi:uncharacterized LabA/DUF88 family protein
MEDGKCNYAYIDGANLHIGIQALGWKLDYKRFRVFLRDKFNVAVAYLFMGYIPEMTALYRDLQNWGYTIIFKPTLKTGPDKWKGNCDAELVLQAMIDLKNYEGAVIVTGDGDFACLVSYLNKEKKLERLVSPNHERCSLLLKRIVPENHLFLERFKEKLEYHTLK